MRRTAIFLIGILLLALTACGKKGGESQMPSDAAANQNPQVTLEMENGDKIVLELYYDMAPNTVLNFMDLVGSQYYDGKVFHRAVPNFMIQGGSPDGTGYGGPGYSIAGEFASNNFTQNTLTHTPGVISMARATGKDTAGSQFFICTGDASFLDGDYAAFGKVISGQEVADKIAGLPTTSEMLHTPQVIKTATVETFGVDYTKPVVIK